MLAILTYKKQSAVRAIEWIDLKISCTIVDSRGYYKQNGNEWPYKQGHMCVLIPWEVVEVLRAASHYTISVVQRIRSDTICHDGSSQVIVAAND